MNEGELQSVRSSGQPFGGDAIRGGIAGYGPDNRLPIKVSARNVSYYRDPAVILIDQLKQIYIDGELDTLDTTQWYPMVMRKDYSVAMNITESEVDDPDTQFYENFACGAQRNYTNYCNKQVDALIDEQSRETDLGKRRKLVWEIQRKLVEDDARPVIFYPTGVTCWQPQLKGLTIMVNSIYNGSRFEDLWLDKWLRNNGNSVNGGEAHGLEIRGVGGHRRIVDCSRRG